MLALAVAACGGDDDGGGEDAGGDGIDSGVVVLPDGGTLLPDGNVIPTPDAGEGFDGGGGGEDAGEPGVDAATEPPDGGAMGCVPASCAGRYYACGDCLDNDGDGEVDAEDPDCLGACDNNEGGYDLGIPGGEVGRCDRDCYYDTNQGAGNDGCEWDQRCDPTLAEVTNCRGSGSATCDPVDGELCEMTCASITPNGCDCFGCCELPARSGNFVFLGTQDMDGNPTCTLDDVEDPERCHPCEPVDGFCYNECGRCELCLGRGPEDLPDDCFPPPPEDAGMPDAGPEPDGGFPDAGPEPDAGTEIPTCDDGRQACGVPGLPECPTDYYCLTGCCTLFF
ncbi:MAG: hypothetical protein CMN31_19000 [Sandaracinus sp.]|nr:hypothetical protein [Myxococcales bacterium]MAT29429.1 hypothetical protein [Sandaracinus sp.]MBJ73386.1 hypothetical protein [Sandaracinus sp.]